MLLLDALSMLEPKWQQWLKLTEENLVRSINIRPRMLSFETETFITRFGYSPAPQPRAEIGEGGQKLLWPQFVV